MSTENDRTIAAYDTGADTYSNRASNRSRDGFYRTWLDYVLSLITPEARIFEIGSATGHDADYIEKCGYVVQRSDVSVAFIESLRASGKVVEQYNVVEDVCSHEYDLMFASAVFLHFTDHDFVSALQHVAASLKHRGLFACSLVKGEGEIWSDDSVGDKRYFHYRQLDEIEVLLGNVGLEMVDVRETEFKNQVWLYFTARKSQ